MNYLLQILRIVIWMTCGFTSMAAFADARDDAMDARSVAMGQMTKDEARERMAARNAAEQESQRGKMEEAQQKADLEQRALELRAKELKAGTVKVSSMLDARLLYTPASLFGLMENPLVTPNGKYFSGDVLIEAKEGELIRVQGVMLMGQLGDHVTGTYAYLKMPKNAINFSEDGMRINGTTSIVGKYSGNINYRTAGGSIKTAPVIECYYYAVAENNTDRLMKLIQKGM